MIAKTLQRSILIALPLAASGCASSPSSSPPTPISHFAMTHPTIVPTTSGNPDSLYVPDPIRVRVGQTITWTNKDMDPHDVTSEQGLFASGPIGADGTYRWTPTRPGTYRYFCTIHPEMHGVVIVRS